MRVDKNNRGNSDEKGPYHFSMRVTPQEKQKISMLSSLKGKPASRAIMDLVEQEVEKGAKASLADSLRTLLPSELRSLPREERDRILSKQAREAAFLYENNPEVIMDGAEDLIDY